MGKMRILRQPIVAQLPGLDRLDRDLFKIRLRSMRRAAPGEVQTVQVQGVGKVVFYRADGDVKARVDGKPVAMADLNRLVLEPVGKVRKKRRM